MRLGQTEISAARDWALELHAGQTDKLGVPQGAHIAHVAAQLRRFGPEYEIAGWLHDAVEDTSATLDEIRARFGAIVARSVDSTTRREGEAYFQDYLPRVIAHPIGILVKYADSRHNRAKIHLLVSPTERSSLAKRYDRVIDTLRNAQWQLNRWDDLGNLVFDGEKWIEAR